MGPIDSNASQRISTAFKSLNISQKKILIDRLGSSDRKTLIQSLISSHGQKMQKIYSKSIEQQIKEVQAIKPRITRVSDFRIPMPRFIKKVIQLFHEILYAFSYISANKAYELIKKELLKDKQTQKPVTKSVLQILIKQVTPGESLSTLLKRNGYSTTINNLSFVKKNVFRGIDVKGISFKNCQFDQTHFSNTSLEGVSFFFCTFSSVAFVSAQMKEVYFQDCEMLECMMNDASMKNVSFINSSLHGCSLEKADLHNVNFTQSEMPGTHFFQAKIHQSSIDKCDLNNTVFFSVKDAFAIDSLSLETAQVTRPLCALFVLPEERGISLPKAYMKLEQNAGLIPLRISFHSAETRKEEANLETEQLLSKIGAYDPSKASIGQRLLETVKQSPTAYPHIAMIIEKVRLLGREVDSFFLPGGEDIPPALYGHTAEKSTAWGRDYRRALTELAVIDQSFHRGIPIMAVCRGFQMANIYFGAQLKQDLEGQKGIQKFALESRAHKGLYAAAFKHSVFSVAMHHQGIAADSYKDVKELEPAVIYDNLVKAAEQKHAGASPMILLQFHPEFYKAQTADSLRQAYFHSSLSVLMSESNEDFWTLLKDSAKAYRDKKESLRGIRNPPPLKSIEKKREDL